MKYVLLIALLAAAACTSEKRAEFKGKLRAIDSPKYDAEFWKTWSDGFAEMASYDLLRPKYNATREGTAVTIFVTETLSNTIRVKADPGRHPKTDEVSVMKLNLIEDFQTGIYDYNLMLSSFVNLETSAGLHAGSPLKVSFSSQEWCGHIFKQALFDVPGVRVTSHSYFDGEADQEKTLDGNADGTSEDTLMLWARGMARPSLKPGEVKNMDMVASLEGARHAQGPAYWTKAKLSRATEPETLTVPAGTFQVDRFTAAIEGGITKVFLVEKAAPHRIIQWESSTGAKAQMVKSDRLKYWQMNSPEGEKYLKNLGLGRRPARTM